MRNDPDLKKNAAELIRQAFDIAGQMQNVDLSALNETRPAKLRYSSTFDLVRDFTNRANGMLEFAGKLGLITGDEGAAIVREAASRYPDLWTE